MSWLFGLKYTGDMVHLASFIFLLYRIHKSRSTNGNSILLIIYIYIYYIYIYTN